MTLQELKQYVDRAVENCNSRHMGPNAITVVIPSYKTGTAGHIPCTNVKSAHLGFDWEASSFLVYPENELREINRDEIKSLRERYEELSWTHYKVSKIKRENESLKEQLALYNKSKE